MKRIMSIVKDNEIKYNNGIRQDTFYLIYHNPNRKKEYILKCFENFSPQKGYNNWTYKRSRIMKVINTFISYDGALNALKILSGKEEI